MASFGLAASPDSGDDVLQRPHYTHHSTASSAQLQLLADAHNHARSWADHENGPESPNFFASCNFSNRGLTWLPAELVDIIGEKAFKLALDHNPLNSLSGISARLGEFRNLSILLLQQCAFSDFPREVLACTALETLDLSNNHIKAIPEDFSRLSKLKRFNVAHNRVTEVPTCMSSMSSLHWIVLWGNPIMLPNPSLWRINHDNAMSGPTIVQSEWSIIRNETRQLKRALGGVDKPEQSPQSASP
ncbi:MAG: hypothetical protein Q9159_002235 [Coniocarpon cinnabarinum]